MNKAPDTTRDDSAPVTERKPPSSNPQGERPYTWAKYYDAAAKCMIDEYVPICSDIAFFD